jgi:hypothetical protein
MRKILTLVAIAAVGGAIGPVMADEMTAGCGRDPQVVSLSTEAMKAKINDLGYEVRRIRVDGGCFRTFIFEPRTEVMVEATFSTATGELVRARRSS